MAMVCEHCGRTLEYSSDPPKFCAYCGVRIDDAAQVTVAAPPGTTADGATVAYEGYPDTTPEDRPPATAAPDAVGGYRLLRELGAGGMGTVYEAESSTTGQRVAVKLLAPQFAAQHMSLERFRQEGQLASLIAHPRCVFVLAADQEAGRPYIVMELMPGDTLRDLVARRGPLPPLDAVAKILDVIDGLREAHRLGILHRDVKPSNCFLMPDGRVKVGDFGLAKSLTGDVQLTQTGAFLGTVLFASPEQVRGEGIDYASDVYSVSATVYFLLTGRAPFQHENAGAVLAKVVSEDPPPIRPQRPEVSRRLERIVLKGLERDKERRWQTLDELHAVLNALVPSTMTRGSLGLRFAALLIDLLVLTMFSILWAVMFKLGLDQVFGDYSWIVETLGWAQDFAYFAVVEGVWGYSLGKLCLRLRVCSVGDTETPPWPRVLLRTAVFVGCLHLPTLVSSVLQVPEMLASMLWLVAIAALLGPMRRRNGYRGLHELASGTRVVQLPWTARPRPFRPVRERFAAQPIPVGRYPREFGPFQVHGLLHADDRATVLLANDPALAREVHLWLRPDGAAPLPPARRMLTRPTRPRWLGGGASDGWVWDAYFAPQGGPLADFVTPNAGLGWAECRLVLEQLAEELSDARADGTLPPELGMDQVWVLPDGRVQLLDFDLDGQYGFAADDAGALALLRQVAVLTVEGERRPPGAPPASIRAPVPRHAVELLDRLLGVRSPFGSLAEFRAALGELREQPTETTRELRTAHVGVQGFFLALGVAWMLVISGLFGWFDLKYTRMAIEWDKKALTALDDPVIGGGGLKPVIHSYNADGQLRDRLQRQLQDDNAYLARRLQSVNAAERMIYNLSAEADSPATDEGADAPTVYEISEATFKLAATRATAQDARTQGWWSVRGNAQRLGDAFSPVVNFVLLAIVPAIWVLWAFVTRGGLALPLMGLALVRADGRKAARWQCAWRAFLVWLPVVVPLWACVQVKVAAPELRYVHSGLWWLAVAVLLGEVILAVLRPWRALHDRLAGTYVVPL